MENVSFKLLCLISSFHSFPLIQRLLRYKHSIYSLSCILMHFCPFVLERLRCKVEALVIDTSLLSYFSSFVFYLPIHFFLLSTYHFFLLFFLLLVHFLSFLFCEKVIYHTTFLYSYHDNLVSLYT